MTDYSGARKNMVECQLHPCGINEERVLNAYNNVPREKFVSEAQRSIAYVDNELPLGHERFLMAPMTHARLVFAAHIKLSDVVLDIGGATGYSAAILSQLATTVVAVESQPDFIAHAKSALNDLDLLNILHVDGALELGDKKHAPYDVIILNGAASEIPKTLLKQLNIDGRLCYIHRESHDDVCGQATILTKRSDGVCDKKVLFEVKGHFLNGFVDDARFSF